MSHNNKDSSLRPRVASITPTTYKNGNSPESRGSSSGDESGNEDPFASGKYAGSFRLRFAGASTKKAKQSKKLEPPPAYTAGTAVNGLSDQQQSIELDERGIENDATSKRDKEFQEESMKFIEEIFGNDEETVLTDSPDQEHLQKHDIGSDEHDGQRDRNQFDVVPLLEADTKVPIDEVIENPMTQTPDLESEPPALHNENMPNSPGSDKPQVDIEILQAAEDDEDIDDDDDDDEFFFSAEQEPVLSPDIESRSRHAVRSVFENAMTTHSGATLGRVKYHSKACCEHDCCTNRINQETMLSSEVKVASSQGFKMLKKFLNPTLPKLLTDLWVFIELAVTIVQFVLAVISLSFVLGENENNRVFNILYLVVASIGMFLALLDAFIYFIQLGSLSRLIRYIYSKLCKGKRDQSEKKSGKGCCQFLGEKTMQKIGESFDVVRSVISELFIYPLVILDIFDLIQGGSLTLSTSSDRINLSLFIIGAIFLIVSVYFMRGFMIISATINLKRIPLNVSKSQANVFSLVTQFAIHALAQLLVHALIIVAVALKIYVENPDLSGASADNTSASPFLIYTAIIGGILPLYGVLVFFIANYYKMRELSIGLWVDMMSLLQSESFASLIFQGEGLKVAKSKAKQFAKRMKLESVKEQFKTIKSTSFLVKIFYPFRIPFLVFFGVLYEILLISFVVCLLFTYDSAEGFRFVLFEQGLFGIFFVLLSLILIANFQILLLITTWLVAVFVILLLVLVSPLVVFFYVVYLVLLSPALSVCYTLHSFKNDIFERQVANVNRFGQRVTKRRI